MRRPPHVVVCVARTHWVVSVAIVGATAAAYLLARKLPFVAFGPKTYFITGGLATLYFLAGTLVWFGAPFGPLVSRLCGLLYLARPQLGSRLWDTMSSPEFKAHFARAPTATDGGQ
jgi:hypothetical protein